MTKLTRREKYKKQFLMLAFLKEIISIFVFKDIGNIVIQCKSNSLKVVIL